MNARHPLTHAALRAVALSSMLAGCAQMQVNRLATPDGSEVYDLRGRDPGRLVGEASRLCARGYDTLRQGQKFDGAESALPPAQWWNAALGYLHDADNQAQLVVSCKAVVLPAAPAASAVPTEQGSAK